MADIRTNGKVTQEANQYFLEVESGRQLLPASLIAHEPRLKDLVGQEVEVLFTKSPKGIIGIIYEKFPPVTCYLVAEPHVFPPDVELGVNERPPAGKSPTCYIPADWMIKGVEKQVRKNLADRLRDEGIISAEVHAKLIG